MEDREFFDHLYQLWSRTTGAENRYWEVQKYTDGTDRWKVYSVGQDEVRTLVASDLQHEDDADFIAGVHGCLPDLWRRLHSALDEADEADLSRDSRECRIFELESEVQSLRQVVENLSKDPPWTARIP